MKAQYSGKRPVMFFQPGKNDESLIVGPRIRIFYPNGRTEWAHLSHIDPENGGAINEYFFKEIPCWYPSKRVPTKTEDGSIVHRIKYHKPRNMEHAISLAKEHDFREGYAEMEFVGEL